MCGAVQTADAFKDEEVYSEQTLDIQKGSERKRLIKLVLVNDHSIYKSHNGDAGSVREFNADLVREMNNI